MRIRSHLGTSFEVWHRRHVWFWFVADPCCDGASIGAAANEAEAICEARSSIEEMAARRSGTVVLPGTSRTAARAAQERGRASSTTLGWNDLLANLERYLTRLCSECA
jgi:hypothetical protein